MLNALDFAFDFIDMTALLYLEGALLIQFQHSSIAQAATHTSDLSLTYLFRGICLFLLHLLAATMIVYRSNLKKSK